VCFSVKNYSMAKYSSLNNRNQTSAGQWFLVVGFGVASLAFLVLPLFQTPLQLAWRWVSVSAEAVGSRTFSATNSHECIVIATPPQKSFDTVVLECDERSDRSVDDFVWYQDGSNRYMVGRVTSVIGSSVVARMYSTSNNKSFIDVRFSSMPEQFSATPLGGGMLRVEAPSDAAIQSGDHVRHAVSGQLLGVVSGVRIQSGSYIKRVYIRLPFSFDRLTRLDVE